MVFDAINVRDAFRYMQKGQHLGKIVLKFPENPNELPNTLVRSQMELRGDASYFLVGGLGGLGQAIAIWMAEHGAKNLIFFSRTGANKVSQSFFDELAELGCCVQVFAGDISDLAAVKNVTGKQTNRWRSADVHGSEGKHVGSPLCSDWLIIIYRTVHLTKCL